MKYKAKLDSVTPIVAGLYGISKFDTFIDALQQLYYTNVTGQLCL